MMRAMPRLVTRIDGKAEAGGGNRGDRDRDRYPHAVREALQEESRDREHAEREDDQDQQRQASGVDPQEQAAEAVVAVGIDGDVLAEEFADREADQHRQQFDAAERQHDRCGHGEGPHVRRQQDVGQGTHCCDLILSRRAAISFSRCSRSSSSSSLSPGAPDGRHAGDARDRRHGPIGAYRFSRASRASGFLRRVLCEACFEIGEAGFGFAPRAKHRL